MPYRAVRGNHKKIPENPDLRYHFEPLRIPTQLSVLPNSFGFGKLMGHVKDLSVYFFDFPPHHPTPPEQKLLSSHYLPKISRFGAGQAQDPRPERDFGKILCGTTSSPY